MVTESRLDSTGTVYAYTRENQEVNWRETDKRLPYKKIFGKPSLNYSTPLLLDFSISEGNVKPLGRTEQPENAPEQWP